MGTNAVSYSIIVFSRIKAGIIVMIVVDPQVCGGTVSMEQSLDTHPGWSIWRDTSTLGKRQRGKI